MNKTRIFFFFFFSSRRRHTRLTCDWSSDVCSSDLCRCQRTACFDEEGLARGREPDPARETMEQCHAHFPLEVADLLRERRLRHAQPTGGSEEAPFFGDRDEVPQVPELHSGQSL